MGDVLTQEEIDGIIEDVTGDKSVKMLRALRKLHYSLKRPSQKAFVKNMISKIVDYENAKMRETDAQSKLASLQLAVEFLAIRAAEKDYYTDRREASSREQEWQQYLI